MKIGIIREGKTPPDSRVPLIPEQCAFLINEKNIDLVIQSSTNRCFPDEAYRQAGVSIVEDVTDCDVLMGVKEVPIDQLIPNKTYFFFSHTIKEQSYNRPLLQAIVQKNIRLIDYEVLTDDKGRRLIAFGKFAGMVGAHNGVLTYGKRTGLFDLKRMKDCLDYAEATSIYKVMQFPPMRIVLTGMGRVANGAALVLDDMGIQKVSPLDYLNQTFDQAVYTHLDCEDYAQRKDGSTFELSTFFKNPDLFESRFAPYTEKSDIMINGIYWDNNAPAFFNLEQMNKEDFNIKVIADVTCDIAPVSSIPSTIKASTIADPIFGFNPKSNSEEKPFQDHVVDMMTIDNLPNELPRDASKAFGEQFLNSIIDELLMPAKSEVIERASVTKDGQLGPYFSYLKNYLEEDWIVS